MNINNGLSRKVRARSAVRQLGAVLCLSLALVAGACSSDAATTSDTTVEPAADVRVVPAEEAQQLLASDPQPVLIDVRTPEEFAAGHLAGAVLVDFNAPDFRDQISAYPRDVSYVIYCRSGNRSAGARAIMTELGFADVADIDGGIVAWTQAGLPITS